MSLSASGNPDGSPSMTIVRPLPWLSPGCQEAEVSHA